MSMAFVIFELDLTCPSDAGATHADVAAALPQNSVPDVNHNPASERAEGEAVQYLSSAPQTLSQLPSEALTEAGSPEQAPGSTLGSDSPAAPLKEPGQADSAEIPSSDSAGPAQHSATQQPSHLASPPEDQGSHADVTEASVQVPTQDGTTCRQVGPCEDLHRQASCPQAPCTEQSTWDSSLPAARLPAGQNGTERAAVSETNAAEQPSVPAASSASPSSSSAIPEEAAGARRGSEDDATACNASQDSLPEKSQPGADGSLDGALADLATAAPDVHDAAVREAGADEQIPHTDSMGSGDAAPPSASPVADGEAAEEPESSASSSPAAAGELTADQKKAATAIHNDPPLPSVPSKAAQEADPSLEAPTSGRVPAGLRASKPAHRKSPDSKAPGCFGKEPGKAASPGKEVGAEKQAPSPSNAVLAHNRDCPPGGRAAVSSAPKSAARPASGKDSTGSTGAELENQDPVTIPPSKEADGGAPSGRAAKKRSPPKAQKGSRAVRSLPSAQGTSDPSKTSSSKKRSPPGKLATDTCMQKPDGESRPAEGMTHGKPVKQQQQPRQQLQKQQRQKLDALVKGRLGETLSDQGGAAAAEAAPIAHATFHLGMVPAGNRISPPLPPKRTAASRQSPEISPTAPPSASSGRPSGVHAAEPCTDRPPVEDCPPVSGARPQQIGSERPQKGSESAIPTPSTVPSTHLPEISQAAVLDGEDQADIIITPDFSEISGIRSAASEANGHQAGWYLTGDQHLTAQPISARGSHADQLGHPAMMPDRLRPSNPAMVRGANDTMVALADAASASESSSKPSPPHMQDGWDHAALATLQEQRQNPDALKLPAARHVAEPQSAQGVQQSISHEQGGWRHYVAHATAPAPAAADSAHEKWVQKAAPRHLSGPPQRAPTPEFPAQDLQTEDRSSNQALRAVGKMDGDSIPDMGRLKEPLNLPHMEFLEGFMQRREQEQARLQERQRSPPAPALPAAFGLPKTPIQHAYAPGGS